MHPSLVCPRIGRWETPGVLNIFRFSKFFFFHTWVSIVSNSDHGDHTQHKFQQKNLSPVSLGLSRWWPGQIPYPETLHKFYKGVLSELISHGQPSSWGKPLIGVVM